MTIQELIDYLMTIEYKSMTIVTHGDAVEQITTEDFSVGYEADPNQRRQQMKCLILNRTSFGNDPDYDMDN